MISEKNIYHVHGSSPLWWRIYLKSKQGMQKIVYENFQFFQQLN